MATRSRVSKLPFPADELLKLVKNWPWLRLRFHVPPGRLSGSLASADTWKKLTTRVAKTIRRVLEPKERYLGFIVVPQYVPVEGLDDFCLTAYVSCVQFMVKDEPWVQKWRKLPKEDHPKLLAAFYRHPALKIGKGEREALAAKWRTILKLKDDVEDERFVRQRKNAMSLAKCLDDYSEAFREWASKQLKGIHLCADADTIEVRLADGTKKEARDLLAVGRVLDGLFSPRAPKPFGFFNNRDVTFSSVARMAITHELDPDDLRKQGPKAFERLKAATKPDPDD